MFLTILKVVYFAILVNTILHAPNAKPRRKYYIDILKECNAALSISLRTRNLSIRDKNTLRNNSTILSANNMLILVFCFIIPLPVFLYYYRVDLSDGNLLHFAIVAALSILGIIILLSQTLSILLSFALAILSKANNKK